MSRLFWLSSDQVERIAPFFPKERGVSRANERKVLGGIIYVIKHGLQWTDAPADYGPHKTLYNRFRRWSENGVFERIFEVLAMPGRGRQRSDDRRHRPEGPSHRFQPKKGGEEPRLIGRTKGGLNTKLHALCDTLGRPVRLHLTEGQRSDFKGADVLLTGLPKAETLFGDCGYDSNKIRNLLAQQQIAPCIPPKKNRE